MFGWRKKRDGFEWHEYVRTTILLRRANRRRKVDAVQQAAVDGLKNVGRAAAAGLDDAKVKAASGLREAGGKGLAAGGAGLASIATLLGAGARAAAGVGRRAWGGLGVAVSRAGARAGLRAWPQTGNGASSGARRAFAAVLAPAAEALARRVGATQRLAIGAAGVALAAGALVRLYGRPVDTAAFVLLALAGALVVLALLPTLARRTSSDGPAWRDGAAMLGWGGAAAAAIFVLGPTLAPPSPDRTANLASPPGPQVTGSLSSAGLLEGQARAISGDTLRLSGRLLRLAEIEAPDREQSCRRPDGTIWRCGQAALKALERFTRRDAVSCEVGRAVGEAIALATCRTAAGTDIGAELVREGHAFADTGFFARYSNQQDEARTAKRGIWAGEEPKRAADYRAELWEEAKKAAPDGCPIKARVSGNRRTYLMPWTPGYARASVRKERGGRWFCSEDEARAAGWQPAGRI